MEVSSKKNITPLRFRGGDVSGRETETGEVPLDSEPRKRGTPTLETTRDGWSSAFRRPPLVPLKEGRSNRK
jgi:hypothetical protein